MLFSIRIHSYCYCVLNFTIFISCRFYVLKTREQSDRRNLTLLQSFRYHLRTLSKSNHSAVTSPLFRGFWFSNSICIPAYGLYLGVYISSKDRLNESSNVSARFYAPFIAGALGKTNNLIFIKS